jgi:hypothetical protein
MSHHESIQQEIEELRGTVAHGFRGVIEAIKVQQQQHSPTMGGTVSAIYGRRAKMSVNVPVPKLLDTEKIVLSVMPRKADGHVDTAATISWTSSDASQVGVEPGTEPFVFTDPQFSEDVTCPGAFNCTATTPLSAGTASVTASASGYESAEFGPIVYEAGQPRSLNASVGSPISDL